MTIGWSEIHTRALEFSKRWSDASSERKESIPFWVAFLFMLYQRYTSLLSADGFKARRHHK